MKQFKWIFASLVFGFSSWALAQAKVMNPGEAVGQLIFLSVEDVKNETEKFKTLNPLSIPVFAELPLDMSVVSGAITLKQQTLLSHVQLKSRARHTPNLDLSGLEGGMQNQLLRKYKDLDWVHMLLKADGSILIEPSTEAAAQAFYSQKKTDPIRLKFDLESREIVRSEDLRAKDAIRVGTKAANYGELALAVNTADRTVVRYGHGIPFSYYQEFVDSNPKIKAAIESMLRDPLMNKVAKVSYREAKLKAIRELMNQKDAVVSPELIEALLSRFDQMRGPNGLPRKLKLRSSTNSEDLPNFNGAGLYDSYAYKPVQKDGKERSQEEKKASIKEALQLTWSSVWSLRAFDERAFFQIPHADVRMGIQVNPAFPQEGFDGVVVTKNIAGDSSIKGPGVYIEVQRGNNYSVTNPTPGVKPQKVLVIFDAAEPLNISKYNIHILQSSNIANDNKTILAQDNPVPVMKDDEIKDLSQLVLKAHLHFKPLLGSEKPDFALDLEFKSDKEDTGQFQIYLKQARPYID